ncbi:hypothetical protein GCL60_16300 [Silvanigrella paludirubra]|uniref:Uncharacterized protein n=1 Tax=Silvanigrella paludirubra TaxID=2499159 RepID=A0A6N6VSM7_9BACT|nr:hypothetical protein [Silvanigrella paludirubra]KAB8035789.1 hypothetical protein GCL60_16300 [Silvanigrella paludirubra]
MTDFISKNGIYYNDFNDEFNYIVYIEETTSFNDSGEPGEWNARIETIKVFDPSQEEEALKYAERLNLNVIEFPKGSRVSISTHKSMFNFV